MMCSHRTVANTLQYHTCPLLPRAREGEREGRLRVRQNHKERHRQMGNGNKNEGQRDRKRKKQVQRQMCCLHDEIIRLHRVCVCCASLLCTNKNRDTDPHGSAHFLYITSQLRIILLFLNSLIHLLLFTHSHSFTCMTGATHNLKLIIH